MILWDISSYDRHPAPTFSTANLLSANPRKASRTMKRSPKERCSKQKFRRQLARKQVGSFCLRDVQCRA